MKYFGAHLDAVHDLSEVPAIATALGATAFSLNLTDPSRWKSPKLSDETAEAFRQQCALHGFTGAQILPHAGFVINLGSPDARKLKLSQLALTDEMQRARQLGLTMVNFHPGAHLKAISEIECINKVSASINRVLSDTEDVIAVIENTAGQGSNVGYSFEQIADMIDGVDDKSRVGVCIDTAHAFAAGYDFSTKEGYEHVWAEFDRLIGFKYLRGMHLNDSMREIGSRIDRHASLGKGRIGQDCFDWIAADKRIDGIPLILETPDPMLWQAEIARLLAISQNAENL